MKELEPSKQTHSFPFSSMNLRQIWVFPMPPIPYRRKKILSSLGCALKCLFKLSRYVSRPVNILLACLRGGRGAISSPADISGWTCWTYGLVRVSKPVMTNLNIQNSLECQRSLNPLSQSLEHHEKTQRICFPSWVTSWIKTGEWLSRSKMRCHSLSQVDVLTSCHWAAYRQHKMI